MHWLDRIKKTRSNDEVPRFEDSLKLRARHLNHILRRERTRADRSGLPLTMLLVGYDGRPETTCSNAATIVRMMQDRARITDEVGWFDQNTGFAVLPDTPVAGGRRFADTVRGQLKGRGIETSFAIYQYVPDTDRSNPDDTDQGPGGHPLKPTPTQRSAPAGRVRHQKVPALAMSRHRLQQAQPLSTFLTRRLPRWKRATDLAVAGSAFAVSLPLWALAAAAIKLDSPGPVIFKQKRAGLGNRPFEIYKFRTMHNNAEKLRDQLLHVNEQDGPAFKIKSDPRITRVGALLRKTSLDELPQLVNILRGDMTLVGPRPLPVGESDACASWQKRRLDVTPGLTCIWQVWGRSTVSFAEWVRMDLRYQRLLSPLKDLKILLATVPAVIKQRGAC